MPGIRAHVTIHGRVQGVGFRFHTCDQADHYRLTGWVRNTWQDTVEAVFEGEEQNVHSMVEWCRRGPSFARVTRVDVQYLETSGEFTDFSVTG